MSPAPGAPRSPRKRRPPTPRRTILHGVAEVPPALLVEVIEQMAARMNGTPEAQRSVGLSLAFDFADTDMERVRYVVERHGVVTLHYDELPADFRFRAPAAVFDAVLQGNMNAVSAGLHGLRASGHPLRLRALMRMFPAVQRAYVAERAAVIEQHSHRYDFRF